MSIQAVRSQCPAAHLAALDAAISSLNPAQQDKVGGILINLIQLLKTLGLQVNFACLISTTTAMLPALIAAFSNPISLLVEIPAFIAAYTSCAHPSPTPVPTP